MHETAEDIEALQALIDRSYAEGGTHLLRIHTPERRLTAQQVSERLQGMCLLALATVSSSGRRGHGSARRTCRARSLP
jgi:predicted DNA-binding transcriptional regulator YafY